MTTEPRYFQHIHDRYVSAVTPEYLPVYVESPAFREVLIAPIPTIEVDEPDKHGARRVHVGDMTVGWIDPSDTTAVWCETRDYRLSQAGGAEAIFRYIEAHPEPDPQPDPESVARVQAVRDAIAALTDDERAEALR